MRINEKIIKGFECCLPMTIKDGQADCKSCPYDRPITLEGGVCECIHELMVDALELVKGQEPRVMTLEEIQHTDVVWLETHGWVDGDVFETVLRCRSDFEDYVTEFATNDDCDITCVNSKIGIEWRCWTLHPTVEQMNNTPWWEERDNGEKAEY